MQPRISEVRLACGIGRNFRAYALELSAADIFQILPLWRSRRRLIEVNGNLITSPDFCTRVTRHHDAIFQRDPLNWDEWNNIRRAQTRMRSGVPRQIQYLRSLTYATDSSFLNGLSSSDQSNHATIVVGIHLAIEQVYAIHFHGFDNDVNFRFVAPFRKIRDAFHQR